jgi:hypothetical protein
LSKRSSSTTSQVQRPDEVEERCIIERPRRRQLAGFDPIVGPSGPAHLLGQELPDTLSLEPHLVGVLLEAAGEEAPGVHPRVVGIVDASAGNSAPKPELHVVGGVAAHHLEPDDLH